MCENVHDLVDDGVVKIITRNVDRSGTKASLQIIDSTSQEIKKCFTADEPRVAYTSPSKLAAKNLIQLGETLWFTRHPLIISEFHNTLLKGTWLEVSIVSQPVQMKPPSY
eukprot:Gregarina_sp_Poly_1__2913@NODE_1813_length_3282_cov_262_359253_g419_i2_p3_GENE_NODE_1813_length_3282_cov_262_359253_g419_i2NODE_1813_length_3282_cov_262_359253_g419_i2_p3_ORF_typecomplete_len110_score2_49ChuX_HutX/PF06228_13/12ChuX_HutX/PF06228_13/15_NODE_1813_length_3282_cov_262_359253_g419_i225462875